MAWASRPGVAAPRGQPHPGGVRRVDRQSMSRASERGRDHADHIRSRTQPDTCRVDLGARPVSTCPRPLAEARFQGPPTLPLRSTPRRGARVPPDEPAARDDRGAPDHATGKPGRGRDLVRLTAHRTGRGQTAIAWEVTGRPGMDEAGGGGGDTGVPPVGPNRSRHVDRAFIRDWQHRPRRHCRIGAHVGAPGWDSRLLSQPGCDLAGCGMLPEGDAACTPIAHRRVPVPNGAGPSATRTTRSPGPARVLVPCTWRSRPANAPRETGHSGRRCTQARSRRTSSPRPALRP